MARSKPHNLALLNRDRGYRYQDRDPRMEELCSIIYASELSTREISEKVAQITGGAYRVSETAIDNWMSGKTRRPQNFTMMWVGYALGYRNGWQKIT